MFPQLALQRLSGWNSDEHTVTRSLAPIAPGLPSNVDDESEKAQWLDTMLRTANLYVIDTDQATDAITDAVASALAGDDRYEMPPLPVSRIAIEGLSIDKTWRIPATDQFDLSVDGVLIDELEIGKRWRTMVLFYPVEGERFLDAPGMAIYGDVSLRDGALSMGDRSTLPSGVIAIETMLAVLTNLITARWVSAGEWPKNKSSAPLKLSKHFPCLAQPYWVSMSNSGRENNGVSDRAYHCRWLVSGHWRRHKNGKLSWVRAYVKGPKGAPWKGRPVHLVKPT